jgi:hypothetical protein
MTKMPKLFCGQCGARATAACNCQVGYIAARVYAEQAIKANPQRSNRAIAAQTGISHETIRQVREATANNLAVRIGLDGKVRRLPMQPYKHVNPSPHELKFVPVAAQLLQQLAPTINGLRLEGKCHDKKLSPTRVSDLLYDFLNIVSASNNVSPVRKAAICEMFATEWDATKLNEEIVAAVASTARAWSDLHKRLEHELEARSNVVLMDAAE